MLTIHKIDNKYYGYNPEPGEARVGELLVAGMNGEPQKYKDFTPKMREEIKEYGGAFILLTEKEQEGFTLPSLVFTNWLEFPEFHYFDFVYRIKTIAWVSNVPNKIQKQIENFYS